MIILLFYIPNHAEAYHIHSLDLGSCPIKGLHDYSCQLSIIDGHGNPRLILQVFLATYFYLS